MFACHNKRVDDYDYDNYMIELFYSHSHNLSLNRAIGRQYFEYHFDDLLTIYECVLFSHLRNVNNMVAYYLSLSTIIL